ncbi:MAG: adenine phosphoribosyltransferase [Clostridiales bacterium]|nr:adenine phosphoribosyltransferase [Clostridiales bacterium]
MDLKRYIRTVPDFPMAGIQFRDITTLLKDKDAYHELIDRMVGLLEGKVIDLVIGPEARGFVLGAAVAYALCAGFIVARKPGKLPAKTTRYSYGLEYGTDVLEVHEDAIKPGQKVAFVDDLLATGGTALATIKLAEQSGGEIVAVRFAIELAAMNGREAIKSYDVKSVMEF